ncbi:MAG: hemolysin family protein [Candidatus Ancillula sp.]|jgi:putative hemolysin|nr:hemolysin family protein [Candidatus Ancillula sp.]
MQPLLDFLLVLALILVGGVFAASELSLVSLRDSQLEVLSEKSKRGAKVAKVARDPNRFLSAAQIGVTFVGFFSASLGAETIKPYITPYLKDAGMSESIASGVALVGLTVVISFVSIVAGELVPKRLAMQRSESISLVMAPIIDVFATVMHPIIWMLSKCADGLVRVLGGDLTAKSDEISEEELQNIVQSHETLDVSEREILTDVMHAAERSISEVMTPRADVSFLDGDMKLTQAASFVRKMPYSRFPVIGDGFDDVLGFVHVRDLLDKGAHKGAILVRDVVRSILKFPGTNQLFPSLKQMRDKGVHIAIVLDEYGGTDGICTLEDIIEEMIGDIHDEYDLRENPEVRVAKDGSFSIDAGISLSSFENEVGFELEDGPYETVAGYMLSRIGHVASVGDSVEVLQDVKDVTAEESEKKQWSFTVTRVEGMRIARVKVRRAIATDEHVKSLKTIQKPSLKSDQKTTPKDV